MTTYVLTDEGRDIIKEGTRSIAELLTLAKDVAEDDTVSDSELIRKAGMSREEAEATLAMLQRLDLIRPITPPKSTPAGYGRFRQDIRRRGDK